MFRQARATIDPMALSLRRQAGGCASRGLDDSVVLLDALAGQAASLRGLLGCQPDRLAGARGQQVEHELAGRVLGGEVLRVPGGCAWLGAQTTQP